jgi:EAL and modified HD-GYP domain-containing signal transduction protein
MQNKAEVLLARQPIFDRKLATIGYELLYRPIPNETADWQLTSGDIATNDILLSAFDEIGLEHLTAGQPAFINFTEHWLNNPPPFNPKNVVVEILEHVPATPGNVAAVASLRKQGYLIALDDYNGNPQQDPFLPYVDIIKLDILAFNDTSRALEIIQSKGKNNFLWLAEKVETQIEYEICLEAGCDYFQGYFFSRPSNIYGNKLSNNKRVILDLLSLLQNPNIDASELGSLLSQDPVLSFRLLKMVNSSAFSVEVKVESLQRAVMLVGINQIKSWVAMLSLGSLEDKPQELCRQSLQRAFFCQYLAECIPGITNDIAFTAGLLSNLDAYFDTPLEQLLDKIHLQSDIKIALTNHSGKLGFIFMTVVFMEKGEWQKIRWSLWKKTGLSPSQIEWFYLESIKKTDELLLSN